MLSILGRPQRVCSGLTRRELLRAGGAGLLGLSVPQLLAAEQAGLVSPQARAKSVIFVFLFGGPSQLETFDLKPDAAEKIRGPFRPIASRTPDLLMCEHLPKLADISDRFCVIRSMTHPHNDHNAAHYIQTGHAWTRSAANGQDVNASDTEWPAMCSVVEYVDQHAGMGLPDFPSYVYLPSRCGALQTPQYDRTGQYAGWLGKGYNPLHTDIRKRDAKDNPYHRDCTDDELDFRVQGLLPTSEMALDRLDRRRGLLEQFDDRRRALDASAAMTSYDRLQQRAFAVATSEQIRTALDIRREPDALRDQYGRNLFGQSMLMARRMVEAGGRFVTVCWDAPDGYGWDSHIHSDDVRDHLLPSLDRGLSALLTDLEQRGLLDETLVVAVGEMGRTPQASATWGRGHWSYCFPCVLSGAGIRGGIAHGSSDKDALYPASKPTSPEDLAATIYTALGIDPHLRVLDVSGRPVSIVEGGRPLVELFG
jgi:hypothetical protein